MTDNMFTPIEDHAIIGDMQTAALVALDGTIDFFCYPNFDSPTVFASLLDREKGGHFKLHAACDGLRSRQLYLPDTNILITRFQGDESVAEVSDFMPLDGSGRIVRRAKAIQGEVDFTLSCAPRFDYGRGTTQAEAIPYGVKFSDGERQLFLYSRVELGISDGAAEARFRLKEGEHAFVVLCPGRADAPPIDADYVSRSFVETSDFWHDWVANGHYPSRWRDVVVRSGLVLKLLSSRKHGSIAAAATFGLPEVPGHSRNWDYRYCWVRDAAFSVYAFTRLGRYEEAHQFSTFLLGLTEGRDDGEMQIMYAMDGRHDLKEVSLDHLEGWKNSQPVRIGNAAYEQLQLDIYGELLDTIYVAAKSLGQPSIRAWREIVKMLDWLKENWRRPDEGIWEVRGPRREFLSSRLMSWVAFDRAARMAVKYSLAGPVEAWRAERDTIYRSIMEEFWDEEIGAFVQYKGSKTVDASVLLMPLVRFINPRDRYWLRTMRAVEQRLVKDCLVLRYDDEAEGAEDVDGLSGREGAFTTCAFWYVEALARTGDLPRARLLFEKLLSYANHVGLYAEELSPSGTHLGNFPQALTHLSLISAAHWLERALDGDEGTRFAA
ncbi:glycoside hydrolase family 15 protein [Afifella sp. H1R]|uniref:glycoside hydrolase family 15 protein n=1 Tax=Afifella sp. H1R TaxID=2908841 RepID=UPI001F3BECAF|nr:glycoside hydrolase family 15 protein [Afifella sp. H1R]MCF1504118.1 glycoside hydrolase family 15 protein [Afifella sp. H1R]